MRKLWPCLSIPPPNLPREPNLRYKSFFDKPLRGMQQKQLPSILLLFFLSFSFFTTTFGQGSIRFRTVRATPEDSLTFHQQFRAYTLATLNTESVDALLRSEDYHSNVSLEVNDQQFDFTMIAHDVRDANYKLQAQTENGIVDYPRSPNKTY